jgi:Caspase domain
MRTTVSGRSLSLLITVFLLAWPAAAQTTCAPRQATGTRLAFVIGNSDYGSGDLVSGKEDAMAVTDSLKNWLGFEVTSLYDCPKQAITDAWDLFKQAIGGASVVVFFYSGHGYQFTDGSRYLQPVDASAAVTSAIPFQTILQGLALAPNQATKLAFVDACGTPVQLPAGASPGVGRGDQIPTGVLVSYAANPGQIAVSGSNGNLSPYTKALVRHIQEPGLTVPGLLQDVHDEVLAGSATGQAPDATEPPDPTFCLRAAVTVTAQVTKVDDGLVAVLRDQIAIDQPKDAPSLPITLTLNAGDNPLAIMVYNQKTFHNSQSWERTEGWSYSLSLRANGPELTADAGCQPGVCFHSDGEDVPFKDGPHHGKVFKVAGGNLHVDPVSAALVLQGVDTEIWKRDQPIYSQQQKSLYDELVKNLPLGQIQAFGGTIDALTLIQQLAAAAQLAGFSQVPDFNALHVAVWGNDAFRDFVTVCMADIQARIADLNSSIGSIFTSQTPFKSFDDKLSQCVFGEAAKQPGNTFTAGDVRVWTALEDPSH